MTSPNRHIPPSVLWSAWKTLKGTYGATVTVPEVNLSHKWVLITGSNNGIGREAAIQFAKSGANLVLACRQPPSYETHPEQAVEDCKAAAGECGGQQVIEWWECDMADLASVEALAKRWNETNRPLDILVNNAGIAQPQGKVVLTRDGFEICHQVNLLSHALLTLSLLPSIAQASSPRIICTTSCLHYWGAYDLSNSNSGDNAYANNKLYFQIWLSELQLRLLRRPDYDHIVVHGVHPGYVKTGIFRHINDGNEASMGMALLSWILPRLLVWVGIDSQQGCLAIFNAATAPEFGLQVDSVDELRGGAKYFNRLWVDDPSPYTRDATSREEVWEFILDELDSSGRHSVREVTKVLI
ncbi:hypothetical protein LOZ53_005007 [Ophidiomyces ophidiicola]|uniref:Uncharacterized protein n=1 Tax=Ophidiomyces ophidiicola TaxID=1387563 RepID=A0ACB8UPD8_9EURO|nr:uncharacterized protein LOZ57_003615 [Ophidiomyces ophidiicola]KAI1906964.1 hypothetical protein LOZ61_006399 [Ophidiomyces ophidiicola]KAI1909546.1 hypothetical protein LOZ64_005210 [Ophidiomyces ophidiicola]KAI1921659.1 hypothetical protein LOZ60_006109 [Ophidiomyces ophidiicola]KAI1933523.1 hypothetical protein LOZ62_006448 [Ophidiomyces ophidiicola]KAI1946845.1 hypothetical protein LOZ57_003615 [Ophidiomyces ophidiicola]